MKKIIKILKPFIINAAIAIITIVLGVVFGNVLTEIWEFILVFLIKKDAYFLASIILWFPGILLGGMLGLMTYEHKRIRHRAEFYRLLQDVKDNQKKECERCSRWCEIHKPQAKKPSHSDEEFWQHCKEMEDE